MVSLNRRSFVFGMAAVAATPALLRMPATQIAAVELPPYLDWRLIGDIYISDPRAPVVGRGPLAKITVHRAVSGRPLLSALLPLRGSYRWSTWEPMHQLLSINQDPIALTIEPFDEPELTIFMVSNIEQNHKKRNRLFHEHYEWKDGKLSLLGVYPLDRRDEIRSSG